MEPEPAVWGGAAGGPIWGRAGSCPRWAILRPQQAACRADLCGFPRTPPNRRPGSGSSSTTCPQAPRRGCTPQAIQSTFRWGNSITTEHIPTTG